MNSIMHVVLLSDILKNLQNDVCNLPNDSRSVLLAEKKKQLDSVEDDEIISILNFNIL